MRIGTYNVLGLRGFPAENARGDLGEPDRVLAHFAAVFSGLDCDVLALQEGPDHATMRGLARRLDRHLAAFPSPSAYPGYVLSRYPILESRVYAHAGPGGAEEPFSRCAGAALLRWTDALKLWVVNVHLHPKDRDLRRGRPNGSRATSPTWVAAVTRWWSLGIATRNFRRRSTSGWRRAALSTPWHGPAAVSGRRWIRPV